MDLIKDGTNRGPSSGGFRMDPNPPEAGPPWLPGWDPG